MRHEHIQIALKRGWSGLPEIILQTRMKSSSEFYLNVTHSTHFCFFRQSKVKWNQTLFKLKKVFVGCKNAIKMSLNSFAHIGDLRKAVFPTQHMLNVFVHQIFQLISELFVMISTTRSDTKT